MAPKTPPLHPPPSSARGCPPWALSGRGKGSEGTGSWLAGRESSQVFRPQYHDEPQFSKRAWPGHGPPLGVSPPCGPVLQHNKVGQKLKLGQTGRLQENLVNGKLFDVWRRVVPAIWSCFLVRFGAATFRGPLGGCRPSCGIVVGMDAKVSSVLHKVRRRRSETTPGTSPWWS
jgi:hypothetical protein